MNTDAAAVLAIVEGAFPYVVRPTDGEMPFHGDGCGHCEMTLLELRKHPDDRLPFSAVRWFHDALSTLSPKATAWVLPAYLRFVLTAEDARDPLATEFLIYGLAPAVDDEDEARSRLALLNVAQLEALVALVGHWKADPHWNGYCGEDLDRAASFLAGLLGGRRTRG
jgi:hypothetical protein